VRNSRPVHTDVVVVAEVKKFLPCELGVVVGDDRVGYAEAVNDVCEERYRLLGANVNNGSSLDPLGELVDRHENVSESPGHLSEWSHHVEVPDSERSRDGNGLKRLRREMSLSSVELAPFTAPYNILRVCDRCGPVKTLSKSLSGKRSQTGVMTAGVGMYLL
jgi:hypothetical protein